MRLLSKSEERMTESSINSSIKPEKKVIQARQTSRSLHLDGNLSKYEFADHISFAGRTLGNCARTATVYTLWNQEFLFIAFDVHSSKLQASVREHDGDRLWWDDGVEFLIDADRHCGKEFLPDDFCYHVNILNVVCDDRGTPEGNPDYSWHGAAEHTVRILDDYHYVTEVAVPWSEIGLVPKEDLTSIGIDFCVNGKDPETGKYDYFDWCNLPVFHEPAGYGELVLRGSQTTVTSL